MPLLGLAATVTIPLAPLKKGGKYSQPPFLSPVGGSNRLGYLALRQKQFQKERWESFA
jgi:hypothetical protein